MPCARNPDHQEDPRQAKFARVSCEPSSIAPTSITGGVRLWQKTRVDTQHSPNPVRPPLLSAAQGSIRMAQYGLVARNAQNVDGRTKRKAEHCGRGEGHRKKDAGEGLRQALEGDNPLAQHDRIRAARLDPNNDEDLF